MGRFSLRTKIRQRRITPERPAESEVLVQGIRLQRVGRRSGGGGTAKFEARDADGRTIGFVKVWPETTGIRGKKRTGRWHSGVEKPSRVAALNVDPQTYSSPRLALEAGARAVKRLRSPKARAGRTGLDSTGRAIAVGTTGIVGVASANAIGQSLAKLP